MYVIAILSILVFHGNNTVEVNAIAGLELFDAILLIVKNN